MIENSIENPFFLVGFTKAGKMKIQYTEKELISGDPLLLTLRQKLKITTITRALTLGLFVRGVSIILLPWLTGTLDVALQDWPSLTMSVTTLPMIVAFYCVVQPSITEELLRGLFETKLIVLSEKEKERLYRRFLDLISSKIWAILVALGVSLGIALHARQTVINSSPSLLWYYNPQQPQIFWGFNLPYIWILSYMAVMYISRQVLVVSLIFRVFKRSQVNFYVLHPDKCGGFAFLGRFSIQNSYFLGVLGLNIGLLAVAFSQMYRVSFLHQPEMVLMLIGYIVATPLLFLFPLMPPHRGMSEAKKQALRQISIVADSHYEKIQSQMNNSGEIDEALLKKLENSQRIYSITQKFPVWPFDTETLRRLAAITILPFIPTIIEFVARQIWLWISKY